MMELTICKHSRQPLGLVILSLLNLSMPIESPHMTLSEIHPISSHSFIGVGNVTWNKRAYFEHLGHIARVVNMLPAYSLKKKGEISTQLLTLVDYSNLYGILKSYLLGKKRGGGRGEGLPRLD